MCCGGTCFDKYFDRWTHRPQTGGVKGGYSWNPIRARRKSNGKVGWACTHASPGCINCYAESINKRFGTGFAFNVPSLDQVEFFLDAKQLEGPAKLKKSATIFVGDMFDLFHEQMPQIMIAQVLWAAFKAPQHVFQFLTKRADRMLAEVKFAEKNWYEEIPKHLWFGVSAEYSKYADERIPLLLQTPAAVRFLSVEPMLEAVDLNLRGFESEGMQPHAYHSRQCEWRKSFCEYACGAVEVEGPLHWVICGGESGPKARPFNLAWAESLLKQCKEAGVPFFMKQVGSHPIMTHDTHYKALSRKGGDLWEFPEHLRVREFPA